MCVYIYIYIYVYIIFSTILITSKGCSDSVEKKQILLVFHFHYQLRSDNYQYTPFLKLETREKLNKILTEYEKGYNCKLQFSSVQFSRSVVSDLCNPMNRSMPGLPVHYQLPEFTQTHVHRISDAIQPSHPLSSLFPPAPNPSQHQSLFQ